MGRNLVESLKNIQSGKDRTHPGVVVDQIDEFDLDTEPRCLAEFCREADFVFHLAGVNRPEREEDFLTGNLGFTQTLLDTLRQCGNTCPVMLSSSIQASLQGRYAGSAYGKSKLAGEELLFRYGEQTGAKVLVYRFANLFGKWCRPHYNSVVATFCHQIARDLPITMNDPQTELDLIYIDDVVEELLGALVGKQHRCGFCGVEPVDDPDGRYCYVPVSHRVKLGRIVELLQAFHDQPETGLLPEIPDGSFEKKLYSTYLSQLPSGKIAVPLQMHSDARGSFTEMMRTASCGQFSVNISKPGVTKGQHWHHSKWEMFLVVSGRGMIRQRRLGTGEVLEFPVSGERLEAVYLLPGYTHSLINMSETEPLVTLIWANEPFDPGRPDTYWEEV